jgi:hypothetical protein
MQIGSGLTARTGGTRVEMRSRFESRDHLERRLNSGEVEGLRQAVGQMDSRLGA